MFDNIKKYPEDEPKNNQTAFVCNHFYDEWWFGMYDSEKKGFWINSRDDAESLELMKIATRWIPIDRPCFMFDQNDGRLSDYMCPKCHMEYKDCKKFKCLSSGR